MIYIAYDEQTGAVNKTAYSSIDMIPEGKSALPVSEAVWNEAQGKVMKVENGEFVCSDPPATMADYDKAVEDHLLAERIARGYTTREPSDYAGSSVPRWAQDAADWIAHRDTVMLYALQVLNDFEAGLPVPTLAEFKAVLPKIQWRNE